VGDVDYRVPADLASALAMRGAGAGVIAGGTDVYAQHVGRPMPGPLIDIGGLEELRGISEVEDVVRIGALTRWSDIVRAELPLCFDGLRAAAREVGSVQVQNAGTVGGNLVNASPAADGVPPLLTLDASVELTSAAGVRVVPMPSFLTGYRSTALAPDELVTAVLVPRATEGARSAFEKLGARRYLVISIVMAAAVVVLEGERIAEAKVAVGACSPVAARLGSLEAALVGREPDTIDAAMIREHLDVLRPIDDVRASAAYRLDAAAVSVRRALARCGAAS
jgi:CO/xanthine dehydrogenase FAD-binding subunit